MPNNFNLQTRSMTKAGRFVLNNAARAGHTSFSSAATNSHRWQIFTDWLRENTSIKWMEHIDAEAVTEYGQELAHDVMEQELAAATAQNYLSAVNTVMDLATRGGWKSISPTQDCHIPLRSFTRTEIPKSLDRASYTKCLSEIPNELGARAACIVELCREFGLRSKEASLLNATISLASAERSNQLMITLGTKGGRMRVVPIVSSGQLAVLHRAAAIQGTDKSMIPANFSWREWRERELREIREALQTKLDSSGLHDLRAAYACERYEVLSGLPSPILGGQKLNRETDRQVRAQIAVELGHGRLEITNAYVGGNKK